MKVALLLSLVLGLAGNLGAENAPAAPQQKPATGTQTPAPSTQKPGTTTQNPAPAQPKPAPAAPRAQAPRRAAQPARSGMAITVTDPRGATIPGISVDVTGPTPRNGVTDPSGQINFPGLQAGTYRLRFSGDPVIAFEKEIVVRAGQVADVDVMLNPAPVRETVAAPPAATSEVPEPPAAAIGPVGQAQVLSIVDLVERELISGSAPRKDTLVSCSGNTRTMLVQLNQPQAERVYEAAESLYYVVAGEGTVSVNERDVPVAAGGYVSVPRGTAHSIVRRGRRPLILLAVLNGEPCEESR